MATATNFFNSTPAPDPRQNPLMAGLAGGLQGAANQGTFQQGQGMANTDAMQKMMQIMAQQGKFGLGQGPAGTNPVQYAGQPGYYDPQGTTPAGAADAAKAGLYNTLNQDKQGSGSHEAVAAGEMFKSLLTAKAQADTTGDFDIGKAVDQYRKYMNDNFNQKSDNADTAPAPWQPGEPKSEGQTPAQAMFSKGQVNPATGQATGINATPRAMKLEGAQKDAAQRVISESLKNKSHSVTELKNYAVQKGLDPNQFEYK